MIKDPLIIDYSFQELMDMASILERTRDREFSIHCYYNSCQSVGCLLGHWVEKKRYYAFGREYVDLAETELRLSQKDIEWLFFNTHKKYGQFYVLCGCIACKNNKKKTLVRFKKFTRTIKGQHDDRKKALARLRKFIYYKLRKRELLGGDLSTNERRQQYEEARKKEGNHNVLNLVLQSL